MSLERVGVEPHFAVTVVRAYKIGVWHDESVVCPITGASPTSKIDRVSSLAIFFIAVFNSCPDAGGWMVVMLSPSRFR